MYNQIKVEKLTNTNNDLFVSNVARVSFGKWHERFTYRAEVERGSDESLIEYLAEHEHTSPFRHVRETFEFPVDSIHDVIDLARLTPFEHAGLVNDSYRVRHSVFGWFALLKTDKIAHWFREDIIGELFGRYPVCAKAFGFDVCPAQPLPPGRCKLFTGTEHNPEFIDVSFRISAPVTIARQAVKHAVSMSWNEISRRYVDFEPELFEQEFRKRPDGSIKQGSGDVVPENDVPLVEILREGGGIVESNIIDVMQAVVDWYTTCVDRNGADLAPETVRGYLPLNLMTTWIWTGNVTSWNHFIRLRDEGHAQLEIQDLAIKIKEKL